ncbi:MAG: hypothetical protein PWQ14_1188, partial [Rikenellaceae bacterium]|nr:hypothetical protein [Rikenellaceae bacterium]
SDYNFLFNSRTGEHCTIYVDGIEVMRGVALLTGITKKNNIVIFELQVINDVKDILNEFKNLYIDELDELNYTWNFTNVRNLLHTIIDGTFTGICMADGACVSQKFISSENAVRTAIDMSKIPIAGNVKKLIDKAFAKIGIEYQSDFFSNSQIFSDLWLCNNKEENLGIWGDDDRVLLDFRYNGLKITDYCLFQLSDYVYNYDNNDYKVYINKSDRNISYNNVLNDYNYYGNSRYDLQGGLTVDVSEADEFDSYVNGATQHIYLAGGCKYAINLDLQNYQMTSYATNNLWRAHIIFKFTDLATGEVEKLNYYSTFVPYKQILNLNHYFEKELEHNTMLDIYIQEDIALHPNWEATSEKYFGVEKNPFDVNITIKKIKGSHVRLQGTNINLYSQLPHISVYELIVNLQKMFNLVFSLDKDTDKLVIEPEIDYYQLNEANLIDITDLVDYNQDIVIEPASTLIDYNKISAKYNISDKDFHNSYCQSQYGRDFGEFKTEFESYVKDELEIKNDFTLTKAAIYPFNNEYIFTANYENENGNLKKVSADKCFIGVRKVHTNAQANELLKIWYNENIHQDYNYSQYNYLDFCSADFDYSYDTPRAVFTNMDTIPLDNLFYNYYYKILQEYITLTGKVVTLKAYFDPLTFSSLSKKRIVYWQNNYWKLLKISDWSPKKSVVSVTLLKMIDVEVPKIAKKPVVIYDRWQLPGWIKPLMIDTEHVSVEFLEKLGNQGALISNKAELVNVSEVNDSAAAVQELNDILYNRYIQDDISKYDKTTHTIVECLLDNFTELEFPDYSYFKGIYLFPVEFIEEFIFSNIIFIGNFKMDNLKIAGDYAFVSSNFSGSLNLPVCNFIGREAFVKSNFTGSLSLPACEYIDESAFYNSKFKTITIGANAELYANCIGAHSAEFIKDYEANGKQAGTYIWDGSHWIYQK